MFQWTNPPAESSSVANSRTNDNLWQGDEISLYKDVNNTRIMFHNVHHLPLHGTDGLEMFINNQVTLQVDLQGFSEHCLDTTKFQIQQTAKNILRQTAPTQATIQLNSSEEPARNHYKPGGTGMLILGHLASRIEPQGTGGDTLGRWSFVHIRRRHFPPLTIISVYQVCVRPTNFLGNTAYHQQQRALNMQGRNIHPRQAFIQDLDQFITDMRRQHHDIIIGGDFNESLQDRNSSLLQLAATHHLSDPFLSKFPHHSDFGTHINGQRRIDIALVTPSLLPIIHKIGYAPFEHSTPSDHRALIIEFHTHMLLGSQSIDIVPAINRGVKTKDLTTVHTFINHLFTEIQEASGFGMLTQLNDNTATPDLVEALDALIGSSEQAAEQRCRRRRPEFYSRTLVKLRMEVSLLKSHLRALRTSSDRTAQLQNKMERTGIQIDLPPTQRLTRKALQDACSRLHEARLQSYTLRQLELEQDIQSSADDKQKKHRLKAIKKAEQGMKTYRILQAMRRVPGTS